MSYWNYRIVKRVHNRGQPYEETIFGIHEAYYDADKKVEWITENPVEAIGTDDLEDLKSEFENMSHAFNQPVINYEDVATAPPGLDDQ